MEEPLAPLIRLELVEILHFELNKQSRRQQNVCKYLSHTWLNADFESGQHFGNDEDDVSYVCENRNTADIERPISGTDSWLS